MGSFFSSPPPFSKYGDIRKVRTTGASERTASADNLSYSGVDASEAMANNDRGPMKKYKDDIYTVAKEKDIHPALIAAIISRESRAGEVIYDSRPEPGWGDWNPKKQKYNAFGLMQVDVDEDGGNHDPEGEWDSEEHLRQATGILIDFIECIQKKFPQWSEEEQLKGGIAAYNMGDGNVKSKNVDKYTTHGDYANDVVARAQWFIKNGYDDD